MIPAHSLLTLALVYGVCAVICLVLLYWHNEPEKFKERAGRAFKLILGLLSYPAVLVGIVMTFALLCVATLCNYTVRRIGGKPMDRVSVKVTFTDKD